MVLILRKKTEYNPIEVFVDSDNFDTLFSSDKKELPI